MQRILLNLIILTLLTGSFASNASAQFITTDEALSIVQQNQASERVSSFLAREEVQQQLIKFGVPPEQAEQRIAALTPQELMSLDAQIGDMPAGGIAEVIGVVVIVLFILELLGVTDVFTAI
ncbi:MAG: PA2779 family protein [Pseudomonadaceae bacterium]|nr:PA2779 family protein [Pseudomonadaceae bacterium]